MKTFALAVAALAALAASAAQATITYSGSVSAANTGATASYSITTDGTLGTLSAPNFVGYTLSINGLDSSGSGIFFIYDGFGAASATATALSFDFSGVNRQMIFYNYDSYLCFSTASTSCIGEPSPSVGFGAFSGPGLGSFDARPASVQVIATAGGVPEPASWAMLIAGFGLTGAAMRRRKVAVA